MMYPIRSNWQMILSQTKIFNIFPGSLQTSSVVKILFSYCNRYTYEYISHRDLWLNRLYFEISISSEKKCLTIGIRYVNNLGPSKFKTGAKNDEEQVCYFNYKKKDRAFNRFLAVRKETFADEIVFSIVSLIDKSNKFKDSYYKIGGKLREFDNNRIQPKQRIREPSQTDGRRARTGGSNRRRKECGRQRRISKKTRFLSR